LDSIRGARTIARLLLLIWLQVTDDFIFQGIYLAFIFLEVIDDLKVGLCDGKVEIFFICELAWF
jgi:hypothetical protein